MNDIDFHSICLGSVLTSSTPPDCMLLEKVEIPTEFRDGIYFFFNRDEIRDRKNS
jgi:hypothetical protein